jgi:hypothetical protein
MFAKMKRPAGLDSILVGFTKTVTDLDKLVSMSDIRIAGAKETIVMASTEIDTHRAMIEKATQIKANISALVGE